MKFINLKNKEELEISYPFELKGKMEEWGDCSSVNWETTETIRNEIEFIEFLKELYIRDANVRYDSPLNGSLPLFSINNINIELPKEIMNKYNKWENKLRSLIPKIRSKTEKIETEKKELKLLEELSKKHKYILIKDKSMSKEAQEKFGMKILKEERLENILEGEPLYMKYNFGEPVKDDEVDDNNILAFLLIKNLIFLNNHWWKDSWPEEAKKTTSLNVNCNDIFAWGCADAEEIEVKDLEDLYDHYKKDNEFGTAIWCIKKRNELPQKPVYDLIKQKGIWDLDNMGLEKNSYDSFYETKK